MKLAPKLIIGFLALVITISCIWGISIIQLNQIEKPLADLEDTTQDLYNKDELNELALHIKYYDEVLTQAARNYAFTEDTKWKDRYKAAEPELDKIIKESIMRGDELEQNFFTNVDAANTELVKMEYGAIELIDQGKAADAIKILESKQYWDLKNIYAQGLADYAEERKREESAALGTHALSIEFLTAKIHSLVKDTTKTLAISIPAILILAIVFILTISKHVTKRLNSLIEWVKKVAAGNFGIQIKLKGNDEINDLADSFNSMSRQLKDYTRKIEVEKTKDEFMTMISHELKTPLVPISGYAGLLLADKYGKLNDVQREKIGVIQSSTQSMLKLISDLLDAQKIELGKLRLEKKEEDLNKIILYTIEKTKLEANKAGILITTNLQDGLHSVCDKNRIGQVISNILLNSIDFCPKNTGKIHVTTRPHGDFVRVVVKDNGIGMTKEKLSKIFVKFYQGDTSVTREHGGTGLGLAVCKGIVEGHDGKIWLESEGVGKGTEVHILLKAKVATETVSVYSGMGQNKGQESDNVAMTAFYDRKSSGMVCEK